MSDDLVDFLRARLDEDAAAAKRVESRWRQIGETGVIVASDGDRAEECANGNWTGIAEHIVRHDPARVLAEIDAKRQLLAVHRPYVPEPDQSCLGCAGGIMFTSCPVVRLLALPYADHADYRDEWRP